MNFTKSVVFASLLLGSMTTLPTLEATAQDAYENENGQYDVFIDDRGRRIYVDPYTGEIVRVVTNDRRARRFERRNRRLSERPSIFEERRLRRLERRARLEEELEDIFSDREQPRDDRYFDQPEIEQDRRIERRQLEPNTDDDTRIARLPKADDPDRMTDVEPRPSWLKAKPKMSRDTITKLQVFLDREGFSPGVIDGAWGANVSKAIAAWQEVKGEDADLTNPLILDKYINKRPPVPTGCPPKIAEIMEECLDGSPEKRPTFEEVDLRIQRLDSENVDPGEALVGHQLHKKNKERNGWDTEYRFL